MQSHRPEPVNTFHPAGRSAYPWRGPNHVSYSLTFSHRQVHINLHLQCIDWGPFGSSYQLLINKQKPFLYSALTTSFQFHENLLTVFSIPPITAENEDTAYHAFRSSSISCQQEESDEESENKPKSSALSSAVSSNNLFVCEERMHGLRSISETWAAESSREEELFLWIIWNLQLQL